VEKIPPSHIHKTGKFSNVAFSNEIDRKLSQIASSGSLGVPGNRLESALAQFEGDPGGGTSPSEQNNRLAACGLQHGILIEKFPFRLMVLWTKAE
jgi:hypothetical protein